MRHVLPLLPASALFAAFFCVGSPLYAQSNILQNSPPAVQPTTLPAPGPAVQPPALGPTTAPAPAVQKAAPPDAAAQASYLKLAREVYQKEYADRSLAGRRALAAKLLDAAARDEQNVAAHYVLLNEALTIGMSSADVEICRKAVDALEAAFKVDAGELVLQVLTKFPSVGEEDALYAWALDYCRRLMAQDNPLAVRRLTRLLSSRVSRGKDAANRAALKSVEAMLAEHDRVRTVLEKLAKDPNDPPGNLAAGRYYCFVQHNFDKGLPLLAKGSDAALKDLAQKDLANSTSAKIRAQLASDWWTLGDEKGNAAIMPAARERARYWYAAALPELSGLQKVLAEKRLAEAPPASAATPASPTPTHAVAANLLPKMLLEGSEISNVNGMVQTHRGKLKTPEEVTVPFRLDVVAKTDSTNLRISFARGVLIFNWEGNQTELRHHDPATGHTTAIRGRGSIPVNEFVLVTWIMTPDASKVLVNGQERAVIMGNYRDVHGVISIYPMARSTVTVKSVTITPGGKQ